jgi:thiol:disulfide interchange protein
MSYPPQQPDSQNPNQRGAYPYYQTVSESQPGEKNTMAIYGFIASLSCCIFPLGMVLSIIGLSQIKKNHWQTGKGFAIAGILINVAGLLYLLFLLVISIISDMQSY